MVLRAMRVYFDYSYNKVLKLCNFEEYLCPNLWKIDEYIRGLKSPKRNEML
jgi:hypothetical protein